MHPLIAAAEFIQSMVDMPRIDELREPLINLWKDQLLEFEVLDLLPASINILRRKKGVDNIYTI